MNDSNSDLLARVDERTKNMVEQLDDITDAINKCVKPELQATKVDIAILQAHERVVIGVLVVVVPVVLTVVFTIIWQLVS